MSNPATHNLKDVFINWKVFEKRSMGQIKGLEKGAALSEPEFSFFSGKVKWLMDRKAIYSLHIYSHSCEHMVG